MASRSIPVRFRVDDFDDRTPETHTIDIAKEGSDAPTVLENPHVDFPGVWRLAGTDGGVPVYELANQVADTSDTVDLGSGHPSDEVTTSNAGRIDRRDISTGGVVDDGRRGDGTVGVGGSGGPGQETVHAPAPGDVHWVEPVQVTSRPVGAGEAPVTADAAHVDRDVPTGDTPRTTGADFMDSDFGVADRNATPDDTVVRQPGIREVDDVEPPRGGDGDVLLQDLGDGGDVGAISKRAVRDQLDASRTDGGTGR